MTEMIDGVDVSGCIYKKDGIADCGMFADGEFRCEGQICLYKQLKRLEQENAKLKKENEILQTSLEMIKNTEGQAHIKAIELTKKLDMIKEKINAHCAACETIRRPKCNDCILSWLLEIIEGAKDE